MTAISAIVRTWNSAPTLERTLASLREQRPSIDEIVVVDSGSVDRTLEICRANKCIVVPYPADSEFNYAKAINIGIEYSAGEEILLVSSHVVFCYPDIVERMSRLLRMFAAAGVYCRFQKEGRNVPAQDDPLRAGLVDVIYSDNFTGLNGFWAPCGLISRAAWAEHPFQESMPTSEDQEWAMWHFQNSHRPTVCIRNAGVLYLNWRYTIRKDAFEYAVVAHKVLPRLGRWRNIARLAAQSIGFLLLGNARHAASLAYAAWETARARFSTSHWHSRMHYPAQLTPEGGRGRSRSLSK